MTHIEEGTIGTFSGDTTSTHIDHTKYNALLDTYATGSCISEAYSHSLMLTSIYPM